MQCGAKSYVTLMSETYAHADHAATINRAHNDKNKKIYVEQFVAYVQHMRSAIYIAPDAG